MAVSVALGSNVGVMVGVLVGSGVEVGTSVGVSVMVGVSVTVGVWLGMGVGRPGRELLQPASAIMLNKHKPIRSILWNCVLLSIAVAPQAGLVRIAEA